MSFLNENINADLSGVFKFSKKDGLQLNVAKQKRLKLNLAECN